MAFLGCLEDRQDVNTTQQKGAWSLEIPGRGKKRGTVPPESDLRGFIF